VLWGRFIQLLPIGAKQLRCPVVLLIKYYGYKGGIPDPITFAILLYAQVLRVDDIDAIQSISRFYDRKKMQLTLPVVENAALYIAWKVRRRLFRNIPDDSPGAIMTVSKE